MHNDGTNGLNAAHSRKSLPGAQLPRKYSSCSSIPRENPVANSSLFTRMFPSAVSTVSRDRKLLIPEQACPTVERLTQGSAVAAVAQVEGKLARMAVATAARLDEKGAKGAHEALGNRLDTGGGGGCFVFVALLPPHFLGTRLHSQGI